MAFVVFVVAAVTDFFDGRLARSSDRITPLGRFLDPLADKILVTAALVAFVWDSMVHVWLVIPVIVRDVVITGLRLYSIYHGRELATSQLAKWKTATQGNWDAATRRKLRSRTMVSPIGIDSTKS